MEGEIPKQEYRGWEKQEGLPSDKELA